MTLVRANPTLFFFSELKKEISNWCAKEAIIDKEPIQRENNKDKSQKTVDQDYIERNRKLEGQRRDFGELTLETGAQRRRQDP